MATSALGMGFDNLTWVSWCTWARRPRRGLLPAGGPCGPRRANADVLLLPGRGPRNLAVLRHGVHAVEEKAAAVLTALAEAGAAVSTVALEARVDLRRTPLELLLKVLSVDGAVERVGGGWRSTGQP